jgi:predicted TPR repeat methyltransferase
MKKISRPASGPRAPQHLPARQALQAAMQMHQQGYWDAAQELYERLIKLDARNANAWHYLGVLLHAREQSEAGLKSIRRSIELDPKVPDWHSNLGNVLLNLGRLEEAADAYAKAMELAPDSALVLNNLGALRRAQDRFDEAEAIYLRALELDPQRAEAHNNLANLYNQSGHIEAALKHFFEAVVLDPRLHGARKMMGLAYYKLGRYDEAARVYRDWLAQDPDNPLPRHYLAACTGQDVPSRAADDYIQATFDAFADGFDANLERLTYRAPQLVADAVRRLHGEPGRQLDILDAGCGTGLCGPLVAPHARSLVGMDLSAQMLARAEARKIYDALHQGELTAYLAARQQAYDLVISADTLCYFGQLDEAARAAHGALRPCGWLIFTVESLDAAPSPQGAVESVPRPDFQLHPHGRYSHRRAYVEQALRDAAFGHISAEQVMLRNEGGKPVTGWLVCAQACEA